MSDARALIAQELASAAAPCVTSSFQAECVVLVHMLREARPDIPVLFLDTVHHFADTYRYCDALTRDWGLNLVTLRADAPSPGLWQQSTHDCCARHKVGPLFSALAGYDVWFTALRREGIGVNVHYIPVHLHPFYRRQFGTAPGLCPAAEAAYEQIVTLPLFPAMTAGDVRDVVEAVTKVVAAFR